MSRPSNPETDDPGPEKIEYSSREVKPAGLLVRDLLCAHSLFVLHHGGSLDAALTRAAAGDGTGAGGGDDGDGRGRRGRDGLVSSLRRYWDPFLSTWCVLLQGNPARDIFGGIKIAACGELGVGVGEEERGSGEREVLEGFVDRVDGLVDLVGAKFGEGTITGGGGGDSGKGQGGEKEKERERWLGTGNEPGAEDGAIFLGVGALSRPSLRDVVAWMEDLYTWGENTYGVIDVQAATKKVKREKAAKKTAGASQERQQQQQQQQQQHQHQKQKQHESASQPPSETDRDFQPPPPLIGPGQAASAKPPGTNRKSNSHESNPEASGMDTFVTVLKMGYGTYWTLGGASAAGQKTGDDNIKEVDARNRIRTPKDDTAGHYLIGLMGEVDEDEVATDGEDGNAGDFDDQPRTRARTLTVSINEGEQGVSEPRRGDEHHPDSNSRSSIAADEPACRKTTLRVVVYVNKPFIFLFLFQPDTESLASEGLYRSLHYQLAPLREPLISSTAYRPGTLEAEAQATARIYDLVWDPRTLTLHSTIPNIPDPASLTLYPDSQVWTRLEALSAHTQILNIFFTAREDPLELERTAKTSRGWWVVWSRIVERAPAPPRRSSEQSSFEERESNEGSAEGSDDEERERQVTDTRRGVTSKEIFLIRKSGDPRPSGVRALSGSYITGGGGGGWADGASRLAQGIGIDTRKYIEGLLNLNR